MLKRLLRATTFAAVIFALASETNASITRIVGPTVLHNESRYLVRFDSAFDTTNRVYLLVWGTQHTGPVNGLFLNESGAAIGGIFAVSDGAQQSGWARVIYSAAQGRFLVSYTKILGFNQHQKLARFVTYAGGGNGSLSPEIPLDAWTGHAGTESGLAYSAPAQRFFVTWWRYSGSFPVSFVAALDAGGNIVSTHTMTNPSDGQSDPEIACDPVNRRCLVVGWSWGVFNGGKTAIWGRFLSDTTGAPEGPDSFYLPAGGYLEEPTIAYSNAGNLFMVAYMSNGQIWGNTVAAGSSTFSATYPVRYSSSATAGQDQGGYGFPSLTYNTATQTMLLSSTAWSGYPVAQEIDNAGNPISGALDFIPDGGADYDRRNKYTIPVANSASSQFLFLDNHHYEQLRVSVYSTGGSSPPPPPPPQDPPRITSISKTPASASMGGNPITVTVNATGAPAPLVFEYWRYSYTFGSWTLAQSWTTANQHTWIPSTLEGGWHKYQVWVRGAGATGDPAHWMDLDPFFVQSPVPRVLSLHVSTPGNASINVPVTVTALSTGGMSGLVEYQFWRYNASTGHWSLDRPWSSNNSYTWTPTVTDEGVHFLQVWVREAGQSAWQHWASMPLLVSNINVTSLTPYTAVVVRGNPITFSVGASGSDSGYEYKFLRYNVAGGSWTVERDYSSSNSFQWVPTTGALGDNYFQIWVRRAGSSAQYAAWIQTDVIKVH